MVMPTHLVEIPLPQTRQVVLSLGGPTLASMIVTAVNSPGL